MPGINKAVGGHWANLPSHGCFVYLERPLGDTPAAGRALVEQMTEGLGVGPENLKVSAKDRVLQWSKFAWKKIDAALDTRQLSVTFLVGEPSEVHLGGRITITNRWELGPTDDPPSIWLAAEASRWSEAQFVAVARSWFRIAATRCHVLSGGVFAAANMHNAKVEASREYESLVGEARHPVQVLLDKEHSGSTRGRRSGASIRSRCSVPSSQRARPPRSYAPRARWRSSPLAIR